MEKADIVNRVNTLRENAKKNNDKNNNSSRNPADKLCPFSGEVCGPHCRLFRADRPAYPCPFQEIPSMSWNLRNLVKKLIG